ILSESRVSLVPNSVRSLIGYGHKVLIEAGAGMKSNFSDHNFSESGAEISHTREEVFKSQVVIKIAPPTLEEIGLMNNDSLLICPLQIPVLPDNYLDALRKKRITALAMEYLQ